MSQLEHLASAWKVSLHQSGSWQHGFISSALASQWMGPEKFRHIEVWKPAYELGYGVIRGLSIVIPDSELRQWSPIGSQRPERPGTVWVPAPGAGFAAMVEIILYSEPVELRTVFSEPVFDVAELLRASAGSVRVIARQLPWGQEEQLMVDSARREALRQAQRSATPARLESLAARLVRMTLIGQQSDGTRTLWDIAANSTVLSPKSSDIS